MRPSGLRDVINDAVAIYFLDPTTAAGFVARCHSNRSSGPRQQPNCSDQHASTRSWSPEKA